MIWIIDIDGTLADWSDRSKRAGAEPPRENKAAVQEWLDKLQSEEMLEADKPIEATKQIVCALSLNTSSKIYYLTGRSEQWRWVTRCWLQDNGFPLATLLMRENADWSSPAKYKSEEIKKLMSLHPGEQFATIDDDYSGDCENMYKNKGIMFLKVMGDK